jgi:hypothetical protein
VPDFMLDEGGSLQSGCRDTVTTDLSHVIFYLVLRPGGVLTANLFLERLGVAKAEYKTGADIIAHTLRSPWVSFMGLDWSAARHRKVPFSFNCFTLIINFLFFDCAVSLRFCAIGN